VALTEQHRNTLYQGLTQAVGDEEAVAAMLSQFPAGDEELATKSFVRTELGRLESKMEVGFATIRQEMAEQTRDLMSYMHTEMRRWFIWSYGALFVLLAAVVAAAKILQ